MEKIAPFNSKGAIKTNIVSLKTEDQRGKTNILCVAHAMTGYQTGSQSFHHCPYEESLAP